MAVTPIPVRGRPDAAASRRATGAIVAGTLVAGLIAGELAVTGNAIVVVAFLFALVPVAIARRPEIGPSVLMFAALVIEQSPVGSTTSIGGLTDTIPLFAGLGPSHLNPIDLMILMLFTIYFLKVARTQAQAQVAHSALGKAMLFLMAAAVLALLVGKAHHGDTRIAFLELRPYVYLGASYYLASRLGTTRRAVRAALWALALGTGIKAIQGVGIYVQIRGISPRPDAILAHEEALFLGVYLLALLALWLFEVRGPLRRTMTWFFPFVLATDLVNSRRTAFLILGICFVALMIVAYKRLPDRRRVIARILVVLALILSVYLPVYWNHTGAIAQPAQALHSAFSPDPRDASSDLYRLQEDQNLIFNISQSGPLGLGFGVPINYALPIVDISKLDPLITYIPHDGLLYIPMRMGILGAIAFWCVLAAGLIGGCTLLKSRDREYAAFGAIIIVFLVGYLLEGYKDQGFFYYRVALVTGSLLGLMQATLRRTSESEAEDA